MALTVLSTKTLGSTDADPGASAALIAATLTDRCAIRRATLTDDGEGTESAVWDEIATDVACRFEKVSQFQEKNEGSALSARSTWLLVLPVGTDIQPADEVAKGTDIFQVTGDDAPVTNPLFLSVMCVWIRYQEAE